MNLKRWNNSDVVQKTKATLSELKKFQEKHGNNGNKKLLKKMKKGLILVGSIVETKKEEELKENAAYKVYELQKKQNNKLQKKLYMAAKK